MFKYPCFKDESTDLQIKDCLMRQIQTPYKNNRRGTAFRAILCSIYCLIAWNTVVAENASEKNPAISSPNIQQTTRSTRVVTETPIRSLRTPRRIGYQVASTSKTVDSQGVTLDIKPEDLPPMIPPTRNATEPWNTVRTTSAVSEAAKKWQEVKFSDKNRQIPTSEPSPAIPFVSNPEENLFLPDIAENTNFESIADENPQRVVTISSEQNEQIPNERPPQTPHDVMETLSEKPFEKTAAHVGDAGPDQEITTLLNALQNSSEPLRFGNQDSETITGATTIERLAQIADAQNPTMEQASRTLDQARGNHLQVGLYPNPVVGYTAGELGDEGSAGKQGGFVQQRIVTAGKLGLNRQVAESEVSQAFYVVEQQRLRVQNDVRAQAMEVLAKQQQIALDQKLLEISQDGLKTAEQLFKSQEVSRADVLQARVEKNSAQLQLDTVRAQYLGAWRQLAAMIGEPELPPTKITDTLQVELQPLQWDSVLAKLLEESPELAEAKAGVQRAQNNFARQKVEPIPDIEAMGGVLYNDVNGYTIGIAQLGASVPLFDRNQGNIASAQANIATARANVRRVELALQNRLAGAFREYEASRRQCYRYSTEILPDAQETLRITMLGYHQGEFTYLQLLTAQRSCFQATRNYIESLQNLRTNAIRIEGLMLSGGLEF